MGRWVRREGVRVGRKLPRRHLERGRGLGLAHGVAAAHAEAEGVVLAQAAHALRAHLPAAHVRRTAVPHRVGAPALYDRLERLGLGLGLGLG